VSNPMEEGQLAAANSQPLSTNPYPEASEQHEEWAEGWHYAKDSDEDGESSGDA
jgi:hypothetical protein